VRDLHRHRRPALWIRSAGAGQVDHRTRVRRGAGGGSELFCLRPGSRCHPGSRTDLYTKENDPALIEAFRARLSSGASGIPRAALFSSADDLKVKVLRALQRQHASAPAEPVVEPSSPAAPKPAAAARRSAAADRTAEAAQELPAGQLADLAHAAGIHARRPVPGSREGDAAQRRARLRRGVRQSPLEVLLGAREFFEARVAKGFSPQRRSPRPTASSAAPSSVARSSPPSVTSGPRSMPLRIAITTPWRVPIIWWHASRPRCGWALGCVSRPGARSPRTSSASSIRFPNPECGAKKARRSRRLNCWQRSSGASSRPVRTMTPTTCAPSFDVAPVDWVRRWW
jgi:hypothetical protein